MCARSGNGEGSKRKRRWQSGEMKSENEMKWSRVASAHCPGFHGESTLTNSIKCGTIDTEKLAQNRKVSKKSLCKANRKYEQQTDFIKKPINYLKTNYLPNMGYSILFTDILYVCKSFAINFQRSSFRFPLFKSSIFSIRMKIQFLVLHLHVFHIPPVASIAIQTPINYELIPATERP